MRNKDHRNNKEIGKRIRSVRMMNNLTQDNLGDMLGITGQAIQKMEAGENMITVNSLMILCEKLDVTPDYILFDKPKTERDVELSFETLEGNQKLQLLFRLLLYVSKVENEKYRNLLESIIGTLD
ncbi:MAG: helix-turn-helix transcriptional regulator [Eubacterium sp.]|nr:helix-turn-helix transcriptional regulator [Eubacterium sp.]